MAVHFGKLKSHQIYILKKPPNINPTNINFVLTVVVEAATELLYNWLVMARESFNGQKYTIVSLLWYRDIL